MLPIITQKFEINNLFKNNICNFENNIYRNIFGGACMSKKENKKNNQNKQNRNNENQNNSQRNENNNCR